MAQRIALVMKGDAFGVGGLETSVLRIARGLAERGVFEVDVVMLRPDRETGGGDGFVAGEPAVRDGVHFHQLCAPGGTPEPAERSFALHLALIDLFQRRDYTLVHGFYGSTGGFHATYAALECGVPAVVGLRGNDIHRDVFDARYFHQLRWALERATAVTAISAEAVRRADLIAGCAGKCHRILNSINPAAYHDGVRRVTDEGPVIGSVAKFRSKKGVSTLVRAFASLPAELGHARLVLVGPMDKKERPAIEEAIQASGAAARVIQTGAIARADALSFIRGMDVFVHPSVHDGCPNAVLEAMLAGAAVVATGVGAVPEMITSGVEGLLVRAGSAGDLSAAITSMLRADRRAFGARARETALTRFALSRELDELTVVYDKCLSS